MGGRGSSSNINTYKPKTYGQITRYEAGQLYKAVKNGNVTAYPETVSTLYDQTELYIRYASERYSQDYRFYDNVYRMTENLINGRYQKAQKIINEIEADLIKRAGKKSKFYKYKKPGL